MISMNKTACLLIVGLLFCMFLIADAKKGAKDKTTTKAPSEDETPLPATTTKPDPTKTTKPASRTSVKPTRKPKRTTTAIPDDDDSSTTTTPPTSSTTSGKPSITKNLSKTSKEEVAIIERVDKDLKYWMDLLSESYDDKRKPMWKPKIRWLMQQMRWIYEIYLSGHPFAPLESHSGHLHEHTSDGDQHQHWTSVGRKEFIRLR